jgi:hypothetical protein
MRPNPCVAGRAIAARLRHPEFRGRIGVARTVIKPPIGIYARAWGSAQDDIAKGVHKPLSGADRHAARMATNGPTRIGRTRYRADRAAIASGVATAHS